MNYYRRYMADYLSKTAGLTLMEHGAYTLLLDYLYLSDGVLPGDEDEICRMVRAVKTSERQAVVKVLGKFFVKKPNGYSNDRAVEEIEKAKPAIEAARTNGVKGGRPKENPVGLSNEPTAKASQPPTTNHQPLSVKPPTTILQPVERAPQQHPPPKEKAKTTDTWLAYANAYRKRYGVDPTPNAKVRSQLSQFIDRVGIVDAPEIAEFYVRHNRAWYVSHQHPVGSLLSDAEGLRTQWLNGRVVTDTEARQADRKQSNLSVAEKLIAEARNAGK